MEGKEVRFGPAASALVRGATTGTSTGAVNSLPRQLHADRRRSCRSTNIMLGEVTPGGVGSGLYGMLVFALLAVFIAGLMVGRTPEYLGKKIQASRDEARGALHPVRAARRSSGFAAVSVRDAERPIRVDLQPGPARAVSEVAVRVRVVGEQQRLGLRRPHGQHQLVQHDARAHHAGRPLLPDGPGARHRRVAGPQAARCPRPAGTFPTDTPLFGGAAHRASSSSSSA